MLGRLNFNWNIFLITFIIITGNFSLHLHCFHIRYFTKWHEWKMQIFFGDIFLIRTYCLVPIRKSVMNRTECENKHGIILITMFHSRVYNICNRFDQKLNIINTMSDWQIWFLPKFILRVALKNSQITYLKTMFRVVHSTYSLEY